MGVWAKREWDGWSQTVGKAGLSRGNGAPFMTSIGERAKQPRILQLRLPQKARPTSPGRPIWCFLGALAQEEPGQDALGQDALDVQVEDDVDHDGNDEEQDGGHGKDVDLVADAFEVFHQLLLLEGVAVSGFADHIKLIFNALEAGVLLDDLGAEFALLGLEGADAFFEGGEIDRRRWRCGPVSGRGWRGHQVGNGGADVAVEQGQNALNEGQSCADGVDKLLHAGGELSVRR